MIASLSLILLCQLAGEALVRGLSLPMPGPVIGLIFLLLLLLARVIVSRCLRADRCKVTELNPPSR
jgi:putative effector of murein hydrolase LrgA (UPF0299 family)